MTIVNYDTPPWAILNVQYAVATAAPDGQAAALRADTPCAFEPLGVAYYIVAVGVDGSLSLLVEFIQLFFVILVELYQGLGIGNGVLHEFFILFVVSSTVAQAFFV